jgi:hypothetical protein
MAIELFEMRRLASRVTGAKLGPLRAPQDLTEFGLLRARVRRAAYR